MNRGVKLELLNWIEAEQWFADNPVVVIPLGAAAKDLLQAAKSKLGLADNTLVIFTSDNGGSRGCVNRPLRTELVWKANLRLRSVGFREYYS